MNSHASLNYPTPWYVWIILFLLAIFLHLSVFYFYSTFKKEDGGAETLGSQGITIGLKKISLPAAPPQKEVEVEKPKPIPKPVEKKQIKPKPKTETPKKPVKKVVKEKPKSIPKPLPIPEPVVVEEPEEIIEEVVEPKQVAMTTTYEPKTDIVEEITNESEAVSSSSQEQSENITAETVLNLGGGNSVAKASYESQLLAWLEQHKRYPAIAKRRGQEGTVTFKITIDNTGRLLSYEIVNKSTYKSLNKAVEKMIRSASPMPPVPKEIQGESGELTYTIPVSFDLI